MGIVLTVMSIKLFKTSLPFVHSGIICNYCISFSVPIDRTDGINLLYIFVDIAIETQHFLDSVRVQFSEGSHLAFVSTIQFLPSLHVGLSTVGLSTVVKNIIKI